MKKIDFGQTNSVIANLGIIISILILAIEVSQNTETQRLLAAQKVLGQSYSSNTALAASDLPEIVAIINSGEQPTPGLRNRYGQNLRAIFAALWQAHYQHEHDFLDAEIFDAYAWRTCELVKNPFVLEWWNENRLAFGKGFLDFVTDCASAESAQ